MRLTWFGHATVLIEAAGARLLTDPVLRDRIVHLRRHASSPPEPGAIDAVLLSHVHHDHLDMPSLRRVGAPVLAPSGTRLRGMSVREIGAGESADIGGARVIAVPAFHDGRRWPVGARREDDTIGFVVEGDGCRVYFAGDTELFDGMAELGPLDAALVPIWGWGTTLGTGHMNPEEAAAALALLRPAVAVPIHWGTFLPIGLRGRHGHLLTEPAEGFRRHAEQTAPEVRIEVLEPGGSLEVVPGGRAG